MQGNHFVDTQLFKKLTALQDERKASSTPQYTFFDRLRSQIEDSADMEFGYKARLKRRLQVLSNESLNVLVLGSPGAGKSALLSALFGEKDWSRSTYNIQRTELNRVTLWEANLPDYSPESNPLIQELSALLSETDENNTPLVDLVMVVLDASSNNIDDCYLDICRTIMPMMGRNADGRLMVVFNKCDKVAHAIRGEYVKDVMPMDAEIWLDCTAAALRYRLIDNASVQIRPLAFSAEAGESPTARPYNLLKLLARTMETLPEDKSLILFNHVLSRDDDHWREHDNNLIYLQLIENACFDAIHVGAHEGDRFGGQLGAFLGRHGRALGNMVSDEIRSQLGISI
ncbi:hypothetical protein [Grimontia sp. NTOU-MAR1]|uniref:hypothetical protein n=1 Tax=Grimontia sp. NTOU-MAR1 TaxID=3111011 RepID=UPI002DBC3188|nr:hypothetical protein [Grimontia sp. NTOU-MAR1]WRW00500.1 hypothetical protein VP504_18760 [Grimontia sp. NTOU-MAR1]